MALGKKVVRGTKYNWDALEVEYATSRISLLALAKKYEINPRYLWKRAGLGRWDITRDKHRAEVNRTALELIKRDEAGARRAHARAARAMMDKGLAVLEYADPTRLSAKDAIHLITSATEIERAAQGIAAITEERYVDLSKLSDADLDAIASGQGTGRVGAPASPSSQTAPARVPDDDDA